MNVVLHKCLVICSTHFSTIGVIGSNNIIIKKKFKYLLSKKFPEVHSGN